MFGSFFPSTIDQEPQDLKVIHHFRSVCYAFLRFHFRRTIFDNRHRAGVSMLLPAYNAKLDIGKPDGLLVLANSY